jgi:hypothetical protein
MESSASACEEQVRATDGDRVTLRAGSVIVFLDQPGEMLKRCEAKREGVNMTERLFFPSRGHIIHIASNSIIQFLPIHDTKSTGSLQNRNLCKTSFPEISVHISNTPEFRESQEPSLR